MTFKAPDSLAEQIAHHLAERIIRGEMKPGERIQEQKVTLALNVSRGSVREALLILERRHLIAILPRRGAHVTELTAHKVQSLCTLMSELYILLGNAVASGWQVQADMLDEVDAPLDDANVGRYARLVKEMSQTVQFIYITHNKIAMEMADQLMGVTMHEPGCSRLVAVDVEEAMAMVDA